MIPPVLGLARLAKMVFNGEDMAPVWQSLTATFAASEADADTRSRMYAALMDMSLIDQMRDNADRGLAFQAQALASCRLYQMPAAETPARLTVLGFVMAGKLNVNTPVEFLLQGSDVTLYLLYVVPGLPLPPVPAHDLAITLVSEAEEARPILRGLERLTRQWPHPLLNRPELIPQFGRECLYRRLAPLAGLEIPATVRVDRETLESVARGQWQSEALVPGGFPLIVRPLDSHAGDGLKMIQSAAEAASYLACRAEVEFHLAPFVDYRSPDGLYRKYRVIVIDGEVFPCHMAASDHWMIHYLNAGMLESAAKRAEEARFMDCFGEDFGRRHGPAIAAMARTLGLDYFGIDCGETPDGNLLVFEAGTALVVHDMDSPDLFPYKGPHMRAIFQAFRAMLSRRASA